MIWQDLLLSRWVDETTLRQVTAAAFDLPVSTVAIIDEVEQLASVPQDICIILERVRQHRDFPFQLTIVLRDADLADRNAEFDAVLRLARHLASGLKTSAVFTGGPLAPSTWVRVRPTGQLDLVTLDTDEAADADSFFVVAEQPFPVPHKAGDARGSRRSA